MLEKTKQAILAIAQLDESCTVTDMAALKDYLDGKIPAEPKKAEAPARLYTISDVCDYFRVTRGTVWKWTQDGRLHPVHITDSQKSIRYRLDDLLNLVEG